MEGIDLDRLDYIFAIMTLSFYTVPRFHNPLGHSYTNDEKERLWN